MMFVMVIMVMLVMIMMMTMMMVRLVGLVGMIRRALQRGLLVGLLTELAQLPCNSTQCHRLGQI
jgi:hypothetical protein